MWKASMSNAILKYSVALFFACAASVGDAFPFFWPASGDIAPWAPTPTDHVILSICDAVQQLWPNAWLSETADAFAVLPVPQVDCVQGAVSLYRLYNNRPDANHRFTTSPATRDQMVATGWIL